jgi:hypothetical protein
LTLIFLNPLPYLLMQNEQQKLPWMLPLQQQQLRSLRPMQQQTLI